MEDIGTLADTVGREVESKRSEAGGLSQRIGPSSRHRDRWFKLTTTTTAFLLGTFVIAILVCLVTHISPADLLEALGSSEIRFSIKLSLITSAISTALCILVSVPTAYAMSRYRFKGKSLLGVMLDLPLALPPVVAGLGLLIAFGTTSLGKSLSSSGISFIFKPAGIVLAHFLVNLPFTFRILRSTFESINPRYENVAKTLGCADGKAFWKVSLPLARNGLIAGAIITWCRGIGEFGAAYMVAGATSMRTETLPSAIFLNISEGGLNKAIAAAIVLILISLLSLFVLERLAARIRQF